MFEQNSSARYSVPPVRLSTTVLAISWGVTAAYLLFHSLLVTHDTQLCFAALLPLIAVWATLERKRWGRMALLGMSATALGLFAASVGYAVSIARVTLPLAQQTPLHCLQMALGIFGKENTVSASIVMCLAALTALYMRRPVVIAEFERGKQKTLAIAQKAIAMTLVGCWGIAFIGSPLPKAGRANAAHAPQSHSKSGASHSHAVSRRSVRSAASPSSL